MLISIILLLFALSILIDYATGLKRAKKKVKILHFTLMLISFCVLVLHSLDVRIPSPANWIVDTLEAIFRLKH